MSIIAPQLGKPASEIALSRKTWSDAIIPKVMECLAPYGVLQLPNGGLLLPTKGLEESKLNITLEELSAASEADMTVDPDTPQLAGEAVRPLLMNTVKMIISVLTAK